MTRPFTRFSEFPGLERASYTVAPVAALCLLLACGTESVAGASGKDTDTKEPSTKDVETGKEGADGGTSAAPAKCEIPTFEDDAEPVPFESLSATVVDETGEPVPDLLAQACGTNVCLNAKSDSDGDVSINQKIDIAKLAFKYGDGLRYAYVAVPVPEGERNYELGELTTLRLPDAEPANRFEPGAVLSSSEARLQLEDETSVEIDVLSYADSEDHVFVARQFPDAVQPATMVAEGFDAVWVFGPQKTKFCPPAQLTVPNTAELPSGSSVDLYLLVTSVDGELARYAEWGKVATATVSEDGDEIVTDVGAGLPELGIIGLRGVE